MCSLFEVHIPQRDSNLYLCRKCAWDLEISLSWFLSYEDAPQCCCISESSPPRVSLSLDPTLSPNRDHIWEPSVQAWGMAWWERTCPELGNQSSWVQVVDHGKECRERSCLYTYLELLNPSFENLFAESIRRSQKAESSPDYMIQFDSPYSVKITKRLRSHIEDWECWR